jgi:hypothetical protein
MVPTQKLDPTILAILRDYPEGRCEVSMNGQFGWMDLVSKRLHEIVDPLEIESALRRLRSEGKLRLRKYIEGRPVRYEYEDNKTDDRWFFGTSTFEVTITDEGRVFWDVPQGSIGFQQSA